MQAAKSQPEASEGARAAIQKDIRAVGVDSFGGGRGWGSSSFRFFNRLMPCCCCGDSVHDHGWHFAFMFA